MRGERARQDDTGTSDVVETWNVADSGEGSQGGAAPVMVSDTPGEYSTANRASHWHGRDEDRTTAVNEEHARHGSIERKTGSTLGRSGRDEDGSAQARADRGGGTSGASTWGRIRSFCASTGEFT